MYERHHEPLLPRRAFIWRQVFHLVFAFALILSALAIGMLGYRVYENLSWDDAFLNAAMLLGGMGPVNAPQTPSGKIFAGFYALFAGLLFLIVAGVLFAPVVHRLLHRFHLELAEDDQ